MEKFSIKYDIDLNEKYTDDLNAKITDDLTSALIDNIGSSLKDNTHESFITFINDYIENKSGKTIDNLIENNDIFEFYLLYQNTIDDILFKNEFFEEQPIKFKVSSMYDYVILGTKKAIKIVLKTLVSKIQKEG